MIEEAISKVCDLQTAATRLNRLDIRDDRNAHYDQRGNVLSVPLPIPSRKHVVNTIESFAAAVARYGTMATCWTALNRVACVLADADDNHRCDTVALPVTPSECFGVLEKQNWTTQAALIDTLRHELAGAAIDPDNTLSVLRNLKFATQSESTGKFSNATVAMGKSVASQVTGEAELPETVSVEFHPFPSLSDEIDSAVVVFCTLFTDPANGKLKLSPRLGEMEKAKTAATRALRDTIKEAVGDVPVFIGTP